MVRSNMSARARLLALPVFALSLLPLTKAHAAVPSFFPAGGKVQAGQAMIGTPSAGVLSIRQSSSKAIISWQAFSISQGGKVQFNNGTGATLNRVTGPGLSSIDGLLGATGSVYLINPNGVIIGKSGVVNVGGSFIASTLDTPDASFLAGGALSFAGSSSAAVINLGKVGALGGDVALIASRVENDSAISAPNGTVGLAAGYSVTLRDTALDEGKFSVLLGGAGTSVTNAGLITAANAELRAEGGNVYALAGDTAGVIRATGVKSGEGKVWLVADGGTLDLAGTIGAEGAGGAPGAVETSGRTVSIQAPSINAHGGTWLVDPEDLTIDQPAATAIETALNAGTNVVEQTTATGVSGVGTANPNGNGDIIDPSLIIWNTSASLTLSAYRNIQLTQYGVFSSNGGGELTLRADNTGTGVGTILVTPSLYGNGVNITSNGVVNLYYNPVRNNSQTINSTSYTTPTNYSTFFLSEGGGTGALNIFMLVNTIYDLQNIQNNGGGSYALGRDIDASGTAQWANGGGFAPISFEGQFDGLGQTITGLTINQPSNSFIGLFGSATNALIENVTLADVNITGNEYVGAVVGALHTSKNFPAPADGSFDSAQTLPVTLLRNINVTGIVSGNSLVGSIAGVIQYGSVEAQGRNVFGVYNTYSPPVASVNISSSASVTAGYDSSYVGGLVGAGVVEGGTYTGSVHVGDMATAVGGLVGLGAAGDSTSSGSVSVGLNASAVGGAVGMDNLGPASGADPATYPIYRGILQNLVVSGAVTTGVSAIRVGGLVGDVEPPPVVGSTSSFDTAIINSSASGAVTVGVNSTDIGGLIGLIQVAPPVEPAGGTSPGYDQIVVQDVSATGAVSAGSGSSNLGGLIGFQGPDTLTEFAYAGGAIVDGAGSQNTGGLIGELLSGSFVSGQGRQGAIYAGAPAQLTNSYATGAVTGDGAVGGLVGQSSGLVTDSYASGKVAGVSSVGGLVGFDSDPYPYNELRQDYYDQGSTGQKQAVGGDPDASGFYTAIGGSTGLSPYAQFTYSGFDFSSNGPWTIFQGDTRPILKAEATLTGAIANAHQLQLVALNLGGSYTLASDIDLSGTQNPSDIWNAATGFVSIGTASTPFTGSLDGQGYTVANLFVDRPAQEFIGLFGFVNPTGVLQNLTLSNAHVTGANHTGALAGFSKGTVNGVLAAGAVSGGYFIGGLLGSNELGGTVTNSAAIGTTDGSHYVGGLVGINLSTIAFSNTYDTVRASGNAAGGLAGLNGGSVSNAYSQAPVSGQFATGGLIGYNTGSVTNVTVYEGAATTGTDHVGGLAGFNSGTIDFATANNAVSGSSFVGGLTGSNETTGVLQNSGNVGGRVSGGDEVGGLTGYNAGVITSSNDNAPVTATGSQVGGLAGVNLGSIVYAYSQAAVSGVTNVGGLVGYNQGSIQTNYSISSVTGSDHVGGLVGRNQDAITTSAAYGLVTGGTIVGGLAGSNEAGAVINQASSGGGSSNPYGLGYGEGPGAPTGTQYVGGLVGINLGAISNVFATTPAIGQSLVGGLIGVNGAGASLSFAYAAGTVSGQSATGGVAGSNAGSVSDVYFDTSANATNQTVEFGVNTGTGASTNAAIGGLKARSAEEAGSYPGFDFTAVWRAPIINDIGFSYPTLKNVPIPY